MTIRNLTSNVTLYDYSNNNFCTLDKMITLFRFHYSTLFHLPIRKATRYNRIAFLNQNYPIEL